MQLQAAIECSQQLRSNFFGSMEKKKKNIYQFASPISQTASTFREVVIQKVCTKHLLGTSRGNYSTQSANKQARGT